MKAGGIMKRGIVFILALLLCLNLAAVFKEKDNSKKIKLTAGLGMNSIFERGSVEQYEEGENDFPVTPSRSPTNFNLALGYHMTHRFSLELMCDLTAGGRVDKRNPSDGDIVHVETFSQLMLTLNGDYQLLKKGRINFHVLGGLGMNRQYGFNAGPYTSQQERAEIFLPVPEETFSPAVNLGAGVMYAIDYRAGLKLDARFVKVFADVNHINSFIVCLRFYVFLHWDGEYITYD